MTIDFHNLLSTVLNLPVYASEADIRDRHRALSLIYHPDKQRDERTKDTAMKSFLEIQKAYESTFLWLVVVVRVV